VHDQFTRQLDGETDLIWWCALHERKALTKVKSVCDLGGRYECRRATLKLQVIAAPRIESTGSKD